MQTTLVRNSQVGDDWIRQMMAANPPAHILDEKGQPTGNMTTGLVRLSFTQGLFKKVAGMKNDPNSLEKFGVTLMWVPGQDLSLLYDAIFGFMARNHANIAWNAYTSPPWYDGCHPTFRDQGEKAMKLEGYTPGGMFSALSSNFQPSVVDAHGNPVVNPAQAHAGAWAICAVNVYSSGFQPIRPKRGPRLGLQSVMIVADDTNLETGGALDARQAFAGVKVQAPVSVPPSAFGQPGPAPSYGAPSTAAYYPPGGAPAAAPGYPPAMPAAPSFSPPGLPAPGAAPGYPAAPSSYPSGLPQRSAEDEEFARLTGGR